MSPIRQQVGPLFAYGVLVMKTISFVSGQTCVSNEYKCVNGNCIPQSRVNNTINDCEDNSDEGPLQACMLEETKRKFQCNNGQCIYGIWWLDGVPDCADSSDENKIIGSRCWVNQPESSPPLCCPCNHFVANSECQLISSPPADYPRMTGICRCTSGWMRNELGTNCTKRRIGDPCAVDPDCLDAMSNTMCQPTRKVCVCQTGYQLVNSVCTKRRLKDNCAADIDCSSVIGQSVCVAGQCACAAGYAPANEFTECRRPQIGQMTCSASGECVVFFNNSECRSDGRCWCLTAFYPTQDLLSCLRYQLGSFCQENSGCQAAILNGQCTSSQCTCMNGYYAVNSGRCDVRTVGMSGCTADSDCSGVDSTRCTSNTCACIPGYQSNTGGTTCTRRRVGDKCLAPIDCSAAVTHSSCEADGVCRCMTGYKVMSGGAVCQALRIGDDCLRSADCLAVMPFSNCSVQQICACVYGYRARSDRAQCERAPLEEIECRGDGDCQSVTPNTRCVNSRCSCATSYYPSMDSTTCDELKIGVLPCVSNPRCSTAMPGTICQRGYCVCTPGSYPNLIGTACVNISIGISPCADDVTCEEAILNSACTDSVCQCVTSYKALTGRACVASQLGQTCEVDDHCLPFVRHSACLEGLCACAPGFNSTDDIICTPLEGGSCRGCSTACGLFIGIFIGAIVASLSVFVILWHKKLRKMHSAGRVAPAPINTYGMNQKWQLEWTNRPPAHIPVMYKSPALKSPEELYGDLLEFGAATDKTTNSKQLSTSTA